VREGGREGGTERARVVVGGGLGGIAKESRGGWDRGRGGVAREGFTAYVTGIPLANISTASNKA
jgi:hypothetical protein